MRTKLEKTLLCMQIICLFAIIAQLSYCGYLTNKIADKVDFLQTQHAEGD